MEFKITFSNLRYKSQKMYEFLTIYENFKFYNVSLVTLTSTNVQYFIWLMNNIKRTFIKYWRFSTQKQKFDYA